MPLIESLWNGIWCRQEVQGVGVGNYLIGERGGGQQNKVLIKMVSVTNGFIIVRIGKYFDDSWFRFKGI